MLRFVLSFFGGIFTTITMGLAMAALSVGAIFYMYGKNLPSADTLENYQPKTLSRIYSAEGRVIDEFVDEQRLYTPIEEIPDFVIQAFKSRIQALVVILDRGSRIDIKGGSVLSGQGQQIHVLAMKGAVLVGKAVHVRLIYPRCPSPASPEKSAIDVAAGLV